MGLKIGILGTRGIPNQYGGFEQFATFLSAGLLQKGHDVIVYNSHKHPYKEQTWNGVPIVRCYDPEYLLGTAGQFVYDFNCIIDARKRNFDVLLVLGYTSSSVWKIFYPDETVIITNMDGLEWKRTKYSKWVRRFLLGAERLAVESSDYHIADSEVIKEYLDKKYNINCRYLPYGAELNYTANKKLLNEYHLSKGNYFLLMARMEPENNIEMILDGFCLAEPNKKFAVIGDTNNKFGRYIQKKYKDNQDIIFIGSLFNTEKLKSLTRFAAVYFHGHSVGGTNPSLLEAMASGVFIAAHKNDFNESVLTQNALYFSAKEEVGEIIKHHTTCFEKRFIQCNYDTIERHYTWNHIIDSYELYFQECCHVKKETLVLPKELLRVSANRV